MTTTENYALRCCEVSKSYPVQKEIRVFDVLFKGRGGGSAIKALESITLQVPRGKIVGILGKNGAGKSTLLRVLAGIYPPSSGVVEANGDVAGLFELGGMGSPSLTGREYAERYLSITVPAGDFAALILDILDFSELGDAFENPVRTYSSGMRARLYFATATVLQHEIYLIDELLSVGDEHFQIKCWNRMRQRLLNGASGVLVTHDWTAILRLCERANVIEKGQLVFEGASDAAVVSYLKLPRNEASVARFTEANAAEHYAESGADTCLEFFVEILDGVPVDFALSVETLRLGLGWEIMLLIDGLAAADKPGLYKVTVNIPKLPLVTGSYSLNVFLSRRKVLPTDPGVNLDARTWTLGNGFTLNVTGSTGDAAANLPFTACRRQL